MFVCFFQDDLAIFVSREETHCFRVAEPCIAVMLAGNHYLGFPCFSEIEDNYFEYFFFPSEKGKPFIFFKMPAHTEIFRFYSCLFLYFPQGGLQTSFFAFDFSLRKVPIVVAVIEQ